MNSREIVLVRHGADDESYIDGKFNASLTIEGMAQSKKMAKQVVNILNNTGNTNEVQMYVSNRLRSLETYEILCDELEKHSYGYTLHIDPRLCGLWVGDIVNAENLTYQQKADMLNSAWCVFDRARLESNDDYHFGDPILDGVHYQLIDGLVKYPYGESQNEFAARVFCALGDILSEMTDNRSPVAITHRGPISIIKYFVDSCNQGSWIDTRTMSELLKLDYNAIVKLSIQNISFCSQALKNYLYRKNHPTDELDGDGIPREHA